MAARGACVARAMADSTDGAGLRRPERLEAFGDSDGDDDDDDGGGGGGWARTRFSYKAWATRKFFIYIFFFKSISMIFFYVMLFKSLGHCGIKCFLLLF